MSVYHCVNRSLRGAFIAGVDKSTGRSYDNRRQWLTRALQSQSEQLCVDVLAFSIESQQLQLLVRTRPDIAKSLSTQEVARRYLTGIPSKAGFDQPAAIPQPEAIKELAKDPGLVARARARLSSLSWFVSQITEPLARNANREDEIRGRFWEGRFHCLPILDGPALAAAVAHVELSPILSGEATTLAGCKATSVSPRSAALKSGSPTWLSSLTGNGKSRKAAKSAPAPYFGIPISEADFFAVLEWTSKQVMKSERGRFPETLAESFAELSVAPDHWLTLVKDFQKIFRRAAGKPESLEQQLKQRGRRHMHGIVLARELFS
ncbi:MAG: hypothetical protein NT069_30640 [Planctomycetota bacterium]|nr:hypothetical protein [Planctomycetota bacterium]